MSYRITEDMGTTFLYRDDPDYQCWNKKEKKWVKSQFAMDAFLWTMDHLVTEITKEEAEEIAGVMFED